MTTIDFIALIFAASAIVDVWFNGIIFAEWRAYFESRTDSGDYAEPRMVPFQDESVAPVPVETGPERPLPAPPPPQFRPPPLPPPPFGPMPGLSSDAAERSLSSAEAEWSSTAADEPSSAGGDDEDHNYGPKPFWMRLFDLLPDRFCELLTCHYCLSHHTPWILLVLLMTPSVILRWLWDSPLSFLPMIPVYSLAATRIGNIVNSMLLDDANYDREID